MIVLESSPLVSSHKSADGFQVLLHPLVLLTISDYITRHSLRRQEGSVVGALLGQQNGREISLEHAFECRLAVGEEGDVVLDRTGFEERLQQYKDVHKAPVLDFVGWFTVAPTSGPELVHLPIHRQISQHYNESAVLLAFHPDTIVQGSTSGGKLPLTIYETVYEGETTDEAGHSSGQPAGSLDAAGISRRQNLRFRELPYTIDTGEAEMISVDFVARGGGNASNVDESAVQSTTSGSDHLGKRKSEDWSMQNEKARNEGETQLLSPEDEELIASLTARANAIKMLHSRILLLKTYLSSLPPSYLSHTDSSNSTSTSSPSTDTDINYPLLRCIQALISRLSLLIPTDKAAFERELLAEKNDVSLVTLMGSLTKSVKDVRDVGKKFNVGGPTRGREQITDVGQVMETHRQAKRHGQPAQMNDEFQNDLGSSGGGTKLWKT
ncbi:MAG: hypothetical protein M1837_007308 [Sclerophora amabilis]|nr:MAG: hypothetical protein M1837_007308 [Sclerophora amabilis]